MRSNGVLTLDVGGTFIKAGFISPSYSFLVPPFEVPSHSDEGLSSFLSSVQEIYQRILLTVRKEDISAILITMPGPFDYQNGVSYMKHKFVFLYGIDLKDAIRTKLDFDKDILFEHDAIAFMKFSLYSENIKDNSIGITLGTGLGYVLYENHEILRNELGSPRDALYSASYKGKTMEDFFSARGFLSFYKGEKKPESALELYRMADNHDKDALDAISSFGSELALALSPYIEEHHVKALFLGGQVSKSYPFFLPSLKKGLKDVRIFVKTEDCPALLGLAYSYYKEKK